jgi:hypothetical protein
MPSDPLNHAIALARAGQHTEARTLLLQILDAEPANDTAWMWLVLVLPTANQRIAALEQWLAINPHSEKARQGLERLQSAGASPVQPPAQPDETPPPVHSPPLVPLYRPGSTPAEPLPFTADTNPPQVVPDETRPHSPWVLGKAAQEDKPETPKTGFADRLRRTLNPSDPDEAEIDLGIASQPDKKTPSPAAARVFTVDIDEPDLNPAQEPKNEPGKETGSETEPGDSSVLDQLRGKVNKPKSTPPTFTARAIIRGFLFLFYLTVFVVVGYFGWQRYGPSISTAVLAGWNRQFNGTTNQSVANDAVSTAQPTPILEITATTIPTDTPVPVIGERPAAGLGLIVYSAQSSQGDLDIFSIPPEGGEEKNWTSDIIGDELDPSLSTDGRLVYSLNGQDIYQIDAQGQTLRLTQDGAGNREPAWSLDNSRIAYVSERDGNPEIYIMNADGSNPARLTTNAGTDISPAWSPDGTRIAFASNRDESLEIYTINADGTGLVRLTYDLNENRSPNWSPDGRWIVFSGNRSGDREIYTLSPDGAQVNRLTFSPGADEHPVWSPDGYWILFTSERAKAGLSNLYAMVRDGSKAFAYFDVPSSSFLTPAWARK